MTAHEVEEKLQAHIDSDPYRGSNTYWPAEEALDAQVEGVSKDLMAAYFRKVQETFPEVPPRLSHRHNAALEAWAAAAKQRPFLHWNAVLLACWEGQADKLREYYQLLHTLYQAASDPDVPKLPSGDPALVEAIRRQLGVEAPGNLPIGWSATVLLEGSKESVVAVYEHVVSQVSDPLLDYDLDDLLRLVGTPTTNECTKLCRQVRERLEQRDKANGQEAFFRALRLHPVPPVFNLSASMEAKSGHTCRFSLSRDWRRSIVSWSVNIGKQQSRLLITDRGLLVNKLRLGRYRLDQLGQLLKDSAAVMKTRWLLPWRSEHLEGLDHSVLDRLNVYCRDWV